MSEQVYNPAKIESKWQKQWEKNKIFKVKEVPGQRKYYLLEMLPYPSGRIHMGHVRNYTIGDVAARYRMMLGEKVLHPMGWDAFGMPAENAAIKHGVHPAKWTYDNIDYMRSQLKRLGFSYDWEREFATCDPDYYKWEQLIFVRMFEKGWAYKKTSQVNWCNSCQTVLANEQAEGGTCWRCDCPVEIKSMSQWFFKTTDYAEELLRGLDKLEGWPERVRVMQRDWIGKSVGANIDFQIEGMNEKIKIFTTRPDTLYGATFMSLAWEHPLMRSLIAGTGQEDAFSKFVERAKHISREQRLADTYEKDGVFTGRHCTNPVTGMRMPIYAANFVLMDYGTGAVMAVPAHDQRDFDFAKKYKLPIKIVINPTQDTLSLETVSQYSFSPPLMGGDQGEGEGGITAAYEGPGTLIDSKEFTGMRSDKAIEAISDHLAKLGIGGKTVTYRLKDWCLSRQRYWGTPIPIIYCDKCGIVAVPEKDLPVKLPHDVELTGEGGSPLAKLEKFIHTKCPKCGAKARRETDTMDTFVESSWYMFRYACPKYDKAPVDPAMMEYWLPVDQYIGGIEHAVGHLIYCRYFTKVMRDLGMLKLDEPVKNLMTQGMVYKDGAKMSKSKGNVVDPDDMISKYGADTVRLFSLFAAPPEKDLEWSDQGIEGANRFIQRVWRLVASWNDSHKKGQDPVLSGESEMWMHKTIKRVGEDIHRWHFNTAIAGIMEYINYLYGLPKDGINSQLVETLIVLLSPFAPHVAQEMLNMIGRKDSVAELAWPKFDPSKVAGDTVTVVIQINGKVRDKIDVDKSISQDDLSKMVLGLEKVKQFTEGRAPKKVIVVPGKLVNIVC